MKFKNIMKHAMGMIPTVQGPRSTFDRTCRYSTTADAGNLYPIYCEEIYPGDDVDIKTHMTARLNTPKVPFMNNVYLDKHWFFVPTRLVWDNFQKFMGEKVNPDDHNDYLIPQIEAPAGTGFEVGSIFDYFGLPTGIPGIKVNALPPRAYYLIWNECFRHQKLMDSLDIQKGDSGDTYADYLIQKRCKRSDYFTSALPEPQQNVAVDVPLSGTAPVIGTGKALGLTDGSTDYGLTYGSATGLMSYSNKDGTVVGDTTSGSGLPANLSSIGVSEDGDNSGLQADLTEASSATVNEWRQAFAMQKIGEKLMRAGNRYVEQLRYRWNVKSEDGRLQRPEFLCSESDYIQVHQVAQTSSTDATSPQGNISAFSYGEYAPQRAVKKAFTEHGYLMCIASIRSDLMYQQGIPREWSRRTVHDFLNPEYVHLGEQAVLSKEIYADGSANDEDVFGYVPRYEELRTGRSKITGKLRSTDPTPLDFWHLAQKFENRPVLNEEFMQEDPPIERVIAVQDEPQFNLDFAFDAKYTRKMPVYSDPGMIDHF